MRNIFLEDFSKWLCVNKRALNNDKTQAITFLKNQGKKFHLPDSIIERSNFLKYLSVLKDKHLKFTCHKAGIVKRFKKRSSVISHLRHFVKRPVFPQYYNTYIEPNIAYGFLIYGCTSRNRLKPIFISQKKNTETNFFKARYYPSEELFHELNVLNMFNYYTVELLNFFLRSGCSVLPTECLNSLYERKVSKILARKAQLHLFFDKCVLLC